MTCYEVNAPQNKPVHDLVELVVPVINKHHGRQRHHHKEHNFLMQLRVVFQQNSKQLHQCWSKDQKLPENYEGPHEDAVLASAVALC